MSNLTGDTTHIQDASHLDPIPHRNTHVVWNQVLPQRRPEEDFKAVASSSPRDIIEKAFQLSDFLLLGIHIAVFSTSILTARLLLSSAYKKSN